MNKQTVLDRLDIKNFFASEVSSIKWNGNGNGQGLCPFHDDKNPSLSVSISDGSYKCFGCNKSGSIFDFYMEKHGVDFQTAFNELTEKAGLKRNDARSQKPYTLEQIKKFTFKGFKYARHHVYCEGNPPYLKAIYKNDSGDKTSRYFTVDGKDLFTWGRKSKPIFFNQELLKQRPDELVFIPEGERDCKTLTDLGLLAITAGSATDKITPEMAERLKGREVIILCDNDIPGHERGKRDASALKGIVRSIKTISFSDLPEKGDVSDWIQAGGTREKLIEIIEAAPEWIPEEPKRLIDSLLKWNDILSLDISTEYLLDKIIPKNSITLLFGRGGIGKTSLCMQIARVIANGLPFDTLQTIKTPVYYVDFEPPLSVLKERVGKIGHSDNLYVWHVSNEIPPPKLDGLDWELYKQLPAGLLICDTLRASHLSDENDSRPMNLIMGRLKELREIGFTILLLHHTPKSNENTFKGSGALLDLCDHVLGLEEVKDLEDAPIEFDRQNLYQFGVRIKTRYEPHKISLNFNPDIKGFTVAKDPDLEKMGNIRELLLQLSESLKQKDLREAVKRELDLPDKEIRKLLKKGTGLYWNTEKGDKNSTVYVPINSVCQFVNTIYPRQTEKQNLNESKTLTNEEALTTKKTVNNSEFVSLSEGICQTEKQELIDLSGDNMEVVA